MAFCESCGAQGEGSFCASCGKARASAGAVHAPVVQVVESPEEQRRKAQARINDLASARHGVPLLLSFFVPGLGQLVKGRFLSAVFVVGCLALAGSALASC